MKKFVVILGSLLMAASTVYAADNTSYKEDFESYNYNAVYNSEDMTVSYDGKTANIVSSQKYIVNCAGGIYESDEAYTANAAENIYAYAKTGDGEGTLVFGGLNNEWHGRYSHPPNTLDCKGGANGELNQYNRRLAVVSLQGNKVLGMNPAQNDYVSTYCIYANDNEKFYEHTKWSTDVYITNISASGYLNIYLSKGALNAPKPFEYLGGTADGRDLLFDILRFSEQNEIYFLGEAKAQYEPKKWYHIEVNLDSYSDNTVCNVRIEDKQTGGVLFESEKTELNFVVNNDKCGIGYNAYTAAKSAATEVYIDNVEIEPLEFYAVIASTRDVSINAKGNTAIRFNSEYVDDSISKDTIKVYLNEVEVEGVSLSLLSQNRVRITLPKLEAAQEYTIVVKNVLGQNGIYADCRIPFRTVSLVTTSNASLNGEDLSVKLTNNSLDDIEVTVVAIGENDNSMLQTNVYRRVGIAKEATVTETLTGVAGVDVKSVYIYVVNSLSGAISPVSDNIVLKAE